MLKTCGVGSMEELIDKTVPVIRLAGARHLAGRQRAGDVDAHPRRRRAEQDLPLLHRQGGRSGARGMAWCSRRAAAGTGMGYSNCHVPSAIRRNILENPGKRADSVPLGLQRDPS